MSRRPRTKSPERRAREARRRNRDLSESLPMWLGGGALLAVLVGLAIWLLPLLGKAPKIASGVVVYVLVDNSASSGTIKKELIKNTATVLGLMKKPVDGVVFRYSDRAENLWDTRNAAPLDPIKVEDVLENAYLKDDVAGRPDTRLARALETVRTDFDSRCAESPGVKAIVCIGTDGGFEDPREAKEEIVRWKGKDVLFLIHGLLTIEGLKLKENLSRAFDEFGDDGHVYMATQMEFDASKVKERLREFKPDLLEP